MKKMICLLIAAMLMVSLNGCVENEGKKQITEPESFTSVITEGMIGEIEQETQTKEVVEESQIDEIETKVSDEMDETSAAESLEAEVKMVSPKKKAEESESKPAADEKVIEDAESEIQVTEPEHETVGEPDDEPVEEKAEEQIEESIEEIMETSLPEKTEVSEKSPEESVPVEESSTMEAEHIHEWETVTETVHHDAVTHEESTFVEDSYEPVVVAWDEVLEKDPYALFNDHRQVHYYWTYYYNPNVVDRWWVEAIDAEGNWSYTAYDQPDMPEKPEGYQRWYCFESFNLYEYQRAGDIPVTGDDLIIIYSEYANSSWSDMCDYHYIRHVTNYRENTTEDIEINEIGRNIWSESGMLTGEDCRPDGQLFDISGISHGHTETNIVVDEEAWDEEVTVTRCKTCGILQEDAEGK